jgi:hypothetical protein
MAIVVREDTPPGFATWTWTESVPVLSTDTST